MPPSPSEARFCQTWSGMHCFIGGVVAALLGKDIFLLLLPFLVRWCHFWVPEQTERCLQHHLPWRRLTFCSGQRKRPFLQDFHLKGAAANILPRSSSCSKNLLQRKHDIDPPAIERQCLVLVLVAPSFQKLMAQVLCEGNVHGWARTCFIGSPRFPKTRENFWV